MRPCGNAFSVIAADEPRQTSDKREIAVARVTEDWQPAPVNHRIDAGQ